MLKKRDINRPNLLKLLTENKEVVVVFTKATTGTQRTMHCTLMSDEIPTNHMTSLHSTLGGGGNPDILPVWDIIKGNWRSFYISRISSVDLPKRLQKDN